MNQVPVQVLDQQLLEENSTNYADATAGPVTVTLPRGGGGHRISVQKVDASANPVTVVGLLRGVQKTVVLDGQFDMILLESDRQGWWWIQGGHRSAASLSATSLALNLPAWTLTQAFQVVSATRDANEAITTASVVWPDGATGTFTTDTASTAFPGAIDAYHVTHVLSGTTKTVTQPAVTRDAGGAVTAQPALTVA